MALGFINHNSHRGKGTLFMNNSDINKYKFLLFDADRTLFDFDKAEYNAVKKLCALLNAPFNDEIYSVYSKINDDLWKQFEKGEVTREFLQTARFGKFLNAVGFKSDVDLHSVNDSYLGFLGEGAYLLPNAKELCEKLYNSGRFTMAIVTNGLVKAQTKRFDKSEIAPFFSHLFISEEIGFQKPDNRYFDFVTNALGISDLSSVLVIGDSLTSDILGAQNAAIDSCWLNPKGAFAPESINPTYTISSLAELLDIL